MPIEFICPNVDCSKKLSVADEKGGKKVKCPKCKGVLRVPLQSGDIAETLAASGQKSDERSALDELQPLLVEAGKSAELAMDYESDIARGGMGKVVQYRHKALSRQVAAKVMLPNIAKSKQHRLRFLEEAQVTGQLEHPNIVPIHELGEDPEGNLFFTMKKVQGHSLGQIIKEMAQRGMGVREGGSMGGQNPHTPTLPYLLNVFLKACDGVAFAHSKGVVHRDLKPDNIMVGDYGEVLVMDWGLAKVLGDHRPQTTDHRQGVQESDRDAETMINGKALPSHTPTLPNSQTSSPSLSASITSVRSNMQDALTMEGAVQGTPQYMPPEQADGKIDEIDQRSDIYSLGAILYELLTLKRPVTGKTPHEILLKVIEHRIIPPDKAAPERNISKELAAIAMKAMAGNQRRRYQTVSDLQKDINLYLEGRAVSAKEDSTIEAITKLVKRNKGLVSAVAIATVVVAVVVAGAFRRVGTQRDLAEDALKKAKVSSEKALAASDEQSRKAMAASRRFSLQAVVSAETGRFVETERRLADAESVLPNSPWILYARGEYAEHKNDYKLAADFYAKAIKQDASISEAHAALMRLKTLGSELASARQLVARIDQQNDAQSLLRAAEVLFSVGAWNDSAKAFERAADVMQASLATAPADQKQEIEKAIAKAKYDGGEARASQAIIGFQDELKGQSNIGRVVHRKLGELSEARPPNQYEFNYTDTSHQFVRVNIHHADDLKYLHPLAGLPIQKLSLTYCAGVRSLRPLVGMPLKHLDLRATPADLTPLSKLPLEYLDISNTQRSDISALKGMNLKHLNISDTQVSDFSPLQGMDSLETLKIFHMWHVTDISSLKGLKLKSLEISQTKVTDISAIRGMPLEELGFYMTPIQDLSPIEGMRLKKLNAGGAVRDFSYIKGMPLEYLNARESTTFDLALVKGMPLTYLHIENTPKTTSLAPLEGMKLEELYLIRNKISDISVLAGMPLKRLYLWNTDVRDLSALKGMPLDRLDISNTPVTDFSTLKSSAVQLLSLNDTKIEDLSVFSDCPHLYQLDCANTAVADLSPLRSVVTLRHLNIAGTKVTSLEPLREHTIYRLNMVNTAVTDLTPIANTQMHEMSISEGHPFTEESKAILEKWKASGRLNLQVVKAPEN